MQDSRLYSWQAPDQLWRSADRLDAATFFARRGKPYREAWVIGRFGSLLGVSAARLCKNERPDGYVCVDDQILPVEVTEVLQEGRKRQEEDWSQEIILQSKCELSRAIDCNEAWLNTAIDKKLSKDATYPPGTVLIVYLNSSLYNFRPERTRAELETCCERIGQNIRSILVLYDGEIYGRLHLSRLPL